MNYQARYDKFTISVWLKLNNIHQNTNYVLIVDACVFLFFSRFICLDLLM